MIHLLAQTPPAYDVPGFDWEKLLLAYGPLGLIAAMLFYFVVRYGPRMIETHMSFVQECKTTQASIAKSLDTLTDHATTNATNHAKTHDSLNHLAAAAEAAAKRHKDTGSDVIIHIENARKTLGAK